MSSETRRITLDDVPVEYRVKESEEATQPRIDVGIHEIAVVVPDGETVDPDIMLQENAQWVLEKKAEYDRYLEAAPERVFAEGETFPFLGESYEVVVERRSASTAEAGRLRLAAHHVEQTSVKKALEQLYRRKARERIEEQAEHFADAMNVSYDKLEIRNQRTKWGSCSASGTLGINWRLIMAPPEIVEYVVIHELAHLEEANHTDVFWSFVAEHDPEYRAHAEWLEKHSAELIFTEDDL